MILNYHLNTALWGIRTHIDLELSYESWGRNVREVSVRTGTELLKAKWLHHVRDVMGGSLAGGMFIVKQ